MRWFDGLRVPVLGLRDVDMERVACSLRPPWSAVASNWPCPSCLYIKYLPLWYRWTSQKSILCRMFLFVSLFFFHFSKSMMGRKSNVPSQAGHDRFTFHIEGRARLSAIRPHGTARHTWVAVGMFLLILCSPWNFSIWFVIVILLL